MKQNGYGKSRFARKTLAVVLCVTMALFMVPAMAFAGMNPGPTDTNPAGDSGQQIEDEGGAKYFKKASGPGATKYDKYDPQLKPGKTPPGTTPDDFIDEEDPDSLLMISKTIEETAIENNFNINLEVRTKIQPTAYYPDALVILLIDVSGSMGVDRNELYPNPTNGSLTWTRMRVAEEAAKKFIDSYSAIPSSYTGPAVTRGLAVVKFGSNVERIQNWTNVAVPANRTTAWNSVNGLNNTSVGAGTNVAGALRYANNLLGTVPAAWANITNVHIILLSDGGPTCASISTLTTITTNNLGNQAGRDANLAVTSGLMRYNFGSTNVRGEGTWNSTKTAITTKSVNTTDRYITNGNSDTNGTATWNNTQTARNDHFYNNARYALLEAIALKNRTTLKPNIHSIGFTTQNYSETERENWAYYRVANLTDSPVVTTDVGTMGNNMTVETFLKSVSSTGTVHNASNDISLGNAFDAINGKISSEAWTVTDPMGQFIGFDGIITEASKNTVTSPTSTNNTLTWNLLQSTPEVVDGWYIYKLSYSIHLEVEGKNEAWYNGGPYATNGDTILKYVVLEKDATNPNITIGSSDQDNPYEEKFFVPSVVPFAKTFTFEKTKSSGGPLPGATFKLEKLGVDAAGAITFTTIGTPQTSATDTGLFSFGVPLGKGSYKLTETGTPSGFLGAGPWYFDISYGQLATCTIYEDGVDPSTAIQLTEAMKVDDNYRIVNVDEGKIIVDKVVQRGNGANGLLEGYYPGPAGITFEVWTDMQDDNPAGTKLGSGETDDSGRVVFKGKEFVPGTIYYVFETLPADLAQKYTPAEPYITVTAVLVTALADDMAAPTTATTGYAEYPNDLKTGHLKIVKSFAPNTDTTGLEFFAKIVGPIGSDGTGPVTIKKFYPTAYEADVEPGEYVVTEVDENGDDLQGWKPTYTYDYLDASGKRVSTIVAGGDTTVTIMNEKITGKPVLQVKKGVMGDLVPSGYSEMTFNFDVKQLVKDGGTYKVDTNGDPVVDNTATGFSTVAEVKWPTEKTVSVPLPELDEGTYFFMIKEQIPDPVPKGWTYTGKVVIAEVTISYNYEDAAAAELAANIRIAALEAAKANVLKEIADGLGLADAIDLINNLDESGYTATSGAVLAEALSAAQAVLDDAEATSEDFDSALEALEAAVAELVVFVPEKPAIDPMLTVDVKYYAHKEDGIGNVRDKALFLNRYTQPEGKVVFSVAKTIIPADIPAPTGMSRAERRAWNEWKTFRFTLTETDINGSPLLHRYHGRMVPNYQETIRITGEGTDRFSVIDGLKVGDVRYFTIKENAFRDSQKGWISFGESYLIKIEVEDVLGTAVVYQTVTTYDKDGNSTTGARTALTAPERGRYAGVAQGLVAPFKNSFEKGSLIVEKQLDGYTYESALRYRIGVRFDLPDPQNPESADYDPVLAQLLSLADLSNIKYNQYNPADVAAGLTLKPEEPQLILPYVTADGFVYFLLKAGDVVEFTDIPLGVLFEVKETDPYPVGSTDDKGVYSLVDIDGVLQDDLIDGTTYEGGAIVPGGNGTVTVNNSYFAAGVEVNIDTINLTSAAYRSLAQGALDEYLFEDPDNLGGDLVGVDNVGEEQFFYEVNFRSTSSTELNAFIVDCPLEGVGQGADGFIRLEGIWTPVVWGDINDETEVVDDDATYRIEYQTYNQADPNAWTLWATPLSIGPSVYLSVYNTYDEFDDLELTGLLGDSDDYITALRFDFGMVDASFTTLNGDVALLNDVNADFKDENGDIDKTLLQNSLITDNSVLDNVSFINGSGDNGGNNGGVLTGVQAFMQSALFSLKSLIFTIAWAADGDWLKWTDPNIPSAFSGQPATLIVSANVPLSNTRPNDIIGSASVSANNGTRAQLYNQDAALTRNLGAPFSTVRPAEMGYGPNGITRYNQITRYETSNARTGDAMNIQLMIVLMAGSLAGMLLLLAALRTRKSKAFAEAGTVDNAQDQTKKKRFRKSSLLSLLIVGLLAGAAFQPAPVSAAAPVDTATNGQYTFFAYDQGFTYADLMAWFDWLESEGIITAAQKAEVLLTLSLGNRNVPTITERVVPVTMTVQTNDVSLLDFTGPDGFDAEALKQWMDPSIDLYNGDIITLEDISGVKIQLTKYSGPEDIYVRDPELGGVVFDKIYFDRPSLTKVAEQYDATVLYRGKEMVEGYNGFSAIIGDPLLADIFNTYMIFIPGAAGAGAGAGAAGAGPDATPGETVIPPVDTPTSPGGGTTIDDNKTPMDPGAGTDAGATGSLPWWAWVIIAAVIVVAVILISRGVNRRKSVTAEEE